ncbi:Uncharacterized protein Adt_46171 [Abeliophyllum distichum]|uniref:Retrotransposon gag domain-containing protein n=1 Tax=Abeliophyllum distichum TaxID=126358 RepID=A0ABD1P1X0_9LAMI
MAGRTRGRLVIDHQDEPTLEAGEEQNTSLPFTTIQQFTALQDQMTTIMNMLQRVPAQPTMTEIPQTVEVKIPPVVKIPPAVEVPPSQTMQTQDWENILNEKVDEAIARRKNIGQPISIKEDPFTEDVMNAALPPKFKEPMGDFDSTTDLIDNLRLFQDRVRLRLHSWPDAIACEAFPITLRKDAREWFDTLPPQSISSFSDFSNKFAICFSSSTRKKKIAMGLMQISQERGESLREYISRFNRATLSITNL